MRYLDDLLEQNEILFGWNGGKTYDFFCIAMITIQNLNINPTGNGMI